MSKIKESSEVTLYTNIDITRGVNIAFQNRKQQSAYFSKHKFEVQGIKDRKFSYLRPSGSLKIQMPIADAYKCNYISFVNPVFENIVFYCMINGYKYINNNVTQINYTVDPIQTFAIGADYGYGDIQREHLSESDHVASLTNPFSPSIYEMSTVEELTPDKSMEIIYPYSPPYMTDCPNMSYTKQLMLQISDFDTEDFPEIQTQFYDLFDIYIASDGTVLKGTAPEQQINIVRGYSIGFINAESEEKRENLRKIFEWLSYHGLAGNVIGHYQMNRAMYSVALGLTEFDEISIQPNNYDIHNKKLLLFPYQYIRVYNNEGDIKEYKYENFKSMQEEGMRANNTVKFRYLSMIEGTPKASIVPIDYMIEGENIHERIDCNQIPLFGYSSDGFLAYVAAQMQMATATRTKNIGNSLLDAVMNLGYTKKGYAAPGGETLDYVSPDKEPISKIASPFIGSGAASMLTYAGSNLNTVGKAIGSAVDVGVSAYAGDEFVSKLPSLFSNIGELPLYNNYEERAAWAGQAEYPPNGGLSPAKAAFAADEYHPGSTNGTLGYYLDNKKGPGTFTFQNVKLKDTVLKIFDDYFSGYGYTSHRLGTPKICAFFNGRSDASKIPHFAPYNGRNVTYIKTSNMHVFHKYEMASSMLESAFNNGMQLLDGREMI